MDIGTAPVVTSKSNRRIPRATGLFEKTLDAAGSRGILIGYLVTGVFVAFCQNIAPDSILTWFMTWLVVLLWPVVLMVQLAQLMLWTFMVLAGVVTAMFVIPYILGMVVLAWQTSGLRHYVTSAIRAMQGIRGNI